MRPTDLYDLTSALITVFPELDFAMPPWALVSDLSSRVAQIVAARYSGPFREIAESVIAHEDAIVEDGVNFRGPVLICEGSFVSSSATLRGGVLLGPRSSVGSSVELKSTIVTGSTSVAHLSYVGNSILGSDVNLEAGVVVANHLNEAPGTPVVARFKAQVYPTDTLKFGAVVGDSTKVGANSVLSPGTILDRGTIVPRLTLR